MSYSERAYFAGDHCHHCAALEDWLRLERKRLAALRGAERRGRRSWLEAPIGDSGLKLRIGHLAITGLDHGSDGGALHFPGGGIKWAARFQSHRPPG